MNADYVIVGGGVVGLCVAWGILKRGKRVTIIDGGNDCLRASLENFGLIWVQSKGIEQPRYAQWSQQSAALWQDFSTELAENTNIDPELQQNGGYDLHFSEKTLEETVKKYQNLKQKLDGNYPYDILDHKALLREEPQIGSKVVGAILHHQDGQVNHLNLLKALTVDIRNMNGRLLSGKTVTDISKPNCFRIHCHDGLVIESGKLVLAAGLGSLAIGAKLGFKLPIRPQRGQILITEELPNRMIYRPSLVARQGSNRGEIQIGDTHEDVGFDEHVTQNGLSSLASKAIDVYPFLNKTKLFQSWSALRILTPDDLPIYQESHNMSGAYVITGHSGITLAAAHAHLLPKWLEGNKLNTDLQVFNEERFSK